MNLNVNVRKVEIMNEMLAEMLKRFSFLYQVQ